MRWFKHFSNASYDEDMDSLINDFGLEGYARWWLMLETIAAQMDHRDERCFVEYSKKKWQEILKGKWFKLEEFFNYLANKNKIEMEVNGNKVKIICRKLVKLRDDHSRNEQARAKRSENKIASKEVEEDTDEELDALSRNSHIRIEPHWQPDDEMIRDIRYATSASERFIYGCTAGFAGHHLGRYIENVAGEFQKWVTRELHFANK